MGKLIKIVGIALSLSILSCNALQINVQSNSPIYGLGFEVNGQKHGGAGHSYGADNMPPGMYRFGVRANSLFGTDVPCLTNGQAAVRIDSNATANLIYNNGHCIAVIRKNK